tara:strand:+ start:223 stop:378 length:156 start_codon:yes stop_codon:yes gene_type:complete
VGNQNFKEARPEVSTVIIQNNKNTKNKKTQKTKKHKKQKNKKNINKIFYES